MRPARESPSGTRIAQVVLRSVHIAAMGLVLGGVALGAGFGRLHLAILVTVLSGLALLLKLGLLGLGQAFPGARLPWYLAATVVASVGSHMPGAWRHFTLRPSGNHSFDS